MESSKTVGRRKVRLGKEAAPRAKKTLEVDLARIGGSSVRDKTEGNNLRRGKRKDSKRTQNPTDRRKKRAGKVDLQEGFDWRQAEKRRLSGHVFDETTKEVKNILTPASRRLGKRKAEAFSP